MKIFEFLKKNILGIIFTFLFLGLIFYNLDFNSFIVNITKLKIGYAFLFIPVYVFNQYLKGFRWKLLVNNSKLSINHSFFIFSISNALNICMPCRFGDFWKAYKTGEVITTPKTELLGTLITERSLDFLSVVCILIFAILRFMKTDFMFKLLNHSLLILVLIIAALLLIIIFSKYILKIKMLANIVNGLKSFGSIRMFFACFGITLFARLFECLLCYILLIGTATKFAFSATLFVIIFNAFAGMVPSVSNYIGAYQYSYIFALGLYGLPKTLSFAIVIVYEFLTLAVLGIISLIYSFYKQNNHFR